MVVNLKLRRIPGYPDMERLHGSAHMSSSQSRSHLITEDADDIPLQCPEHMRKSYESKGKEGNPDLQSLQ